MPCHSIGAFKFTSTSSSRHAHPELTAAYMHILYNYIMPHFKNSRRLVPTSLIRKNAGIQMSLLCKSSPPSAAGVANGCRIAGWLMAATPDAGPDAQTSGSKLWPKRRPRLQPPQRYVVHRVHAWGSSGCRAGTTAQIASEQQTCQTCRCQGLIRMRAARGSFARRCGTWRS